MNKSSYLIGLVFLLACKGQKHMPENSKRDTTYTLDREKFSRVANSTALELHIVEYVDSLNKVGGEEELPVFLNDPQFDYKHRGIWISFHTPISVRDQIINRVNSCKTLHLIIDSKNDNYKKKPKIQDDLVPPLADLSFYDLAVKRLKSLDCK